MNLLSGEIVRISIEDGTRIAKVRVGGVLLRVPLSLLVDGNVGDTVLIESGVAIAKIGEQPTKEN